jgi:hypothetical protein
MDVCSMLNSLIDDQDPPSQVIADMLLNQAIRLDQGRPNDDMSIVVLKVLAQETDQIRRMTVRLPFRETSNMLLRDTETADDEHEQNNN